jgi:epsilon-lactone hydrolase
VLAEAREAIADLGAKLHNHVHTNNVKVAVK